MYDYLSTVSVLILTVTFNKLFKKHSKNTFSKNNFKAWKKSLRNIKKIQARLNIIQKLLPYYYTQWYKYTLITITDVLNLNSLI